MDADDRCRSCGTSLPAGEVRCSDCGADRRISIDFAPAGRNGTAVLTIKRNNEVLAVEKIDTAKAAERNRLADMICQGRPDERDEIDRTLLDIAAAMQDERRPQPEPSGLPEIDCAAIVRPERFVATEVSGLAVPSITEIDGQPVGRWRLYLRWSDGKRESIALARTIALPDGSRLFVHPQPPPPESYAAASWSSASRADWLRGVAAPDPADLFRRLCERIADFLELPSEHAAGITAALALWSLLTYLYPAWLAVPYLYVGGAVGSGKSRVFEVLSRLVFRPLVSSNLTGPALFRTLHQQGGTLLYDEAERMKQASAPDVSETLALLLAGYKRGGQATRLEKVGDTFRTATFDVFGPKALACIAGVPPALASRCIPLTMLRAAPGSPKPRRRIDADPAAWQALRDDLHALALEHGPTWIELTERSEVCPSAMSGRDYELWQPLLALAWWLESSGAAGLHSLVRDHALRTVDGGRDDQAPEADELLLRLLADAIKAGEQPKPGELLAKAREAEPELFRKWSAKGVSAHLKRYGLETNKSCGSKVYSRVTVEALQTIQTNYGIELGFE